MLLHYLKSWLIFLDSLRVTRKLERYAECPHCIGWKIAFRFCCALCFCLLRFWSESCLYVYGNDLCQTKEDELGAKYQPDPLSSQLQSWPELVFRVPPLFCLLSCIFSGSVRLYDTVDCTWKESSKRAKKLSPVCASVKIWEPPLFYFLSALLLLNFANFWHLMVKGGKKTPKCLGTMNRTFHNLHLLSLPSPALQQAAAYIRLLVQYVATCSFVQHFFSSFFASEFALHLQHPRQISVTCLKNPYCVCKISTTGMIWRLVTKAAPSCQNCTKA